MSTFASCDLYRPGHNRKLKFITNLKCLPEKRGLSYTQKTVIPMSPKILEHPSASTEPFPKQVFERVFNEKLNSI